MDRMKVWFLLAVALAVAAVACGGDSDDVVTPEPVGTSPAIFTSGAFSSGGAIPIEFTCDGDNTAPPLNWRRVTVGTQSLAVVMVSIVLARFNGWVLDMIGRDVWTRAAVNLAGFAVLIAVAYIVSWFKSQPWRARPLDRAATKQQPGAAEGRGQPRRPVRGG